MRAAQENEKKKIRGGDPPSRAPEHESYGSHETHEEKKHRSEATNNWRKMMDRRFSALG